MSIGMVLEGGGMRGLYTAGVLDVLLEKGICVDGIIGVSAGAAFGCNFKSKQIGRVIRYNKKYCKDPRYAGIRSFIKTGDFFGAEFCYSDIPKKLDIFDTDTFSASPEKFYVVCTDIESGVPVYHELKTGRDNDLVWMRASASMPLASKVVEVDGKKLLDGGMSDSIPLKKMQELGFEKNIVVLTQPEGYQKKKNNLLPLMRIIYKKYPNVEKIMARRHLMYNGELKFVSEQEKTGNTFVIRPSNDFSIKRTENNPDNLQKMYDLGRSDGMACLENLRLFLK